MATLESRPSSRNIKRRGSQLFKSVLRQKWRAGMDIKRVNTSAKNALCPFICCRCWWNSAILWWRIGYDPEQAGIFSRFSLTTSSNPALGLSGFGWKVCVWVQSNTSLITGSMQITFAKDDQGPKRIAPHDFCLTTYLVLIQYFTLWTNNSK